MDPHVCRISGFPGGVKRRRAFPLPTDLHQDPVEAAESGVLLAFSRWMSYSAGVGCPSQIGWTRREPKESTKTHTFDQASHAALRAIGWTGKEAA
jgi:hypothetical protein